MAAKPGDIVIIDMAKNACQPGLQGSRTTVFIPRAELERSGGRNLHGLVLVRHQTDNAVVIQLYSRLNAVVPDLSMDEAIAAQKVMLTFLRTGITAWRKIWSGFCLLISVKSAFSHSSIKIFPTRFWAPAQSFRISMCPFSSLSGIRE
ncbi:AraC family transcriptional regulator [Brucella suis]|nr:AraC family transcriptional regulator [Brucella suis]